MKWLYVLICISVVAAVLPPHAIGDDNCKIERVRKRTSPPASESATRKIEYVGQMPGEAESKVKVQLWAVVIGVSLYKQAEQPVNGMTIRNLKYAADDAQSVYDFLRSRQGGSFPETNINLLLDEDATKANIERSLKWLEQAQRQDYFVIFIAAHGAIVPSKEDSSANTPYFIAYDTDLNDVPGTAIDMRVIQDMMKEKKLPAKGLVICDTCHSAGVVDERRRAGSSSIPSLSIPANSAFIKEINSLEEGVGFLLAAGQLEGSMELDSLYHGVFTYCLLDALRGEADFNYDGKVNFCEVGNYLVEEVPKLTKDQHVLVFPKTIDANLLPLSIVSYSINERDEYSTLVIRSPDIDGVEFALDGKPFGKLTVGIETSLMVRPEQHKIEFSRDGRSLGSLTVVPESGKFTKVDIQSAFSERSDVERQKGLPTIYYLPEKELSEKAETLYKQGVENFDKQRFQEAIKDFDAALNENKGTYQRALVYRGRALQSLQRHGEAVESFKRGLDLKPSDYEAETLLMEARLASGLNSNDIVKSLKDIIRRHPNYFYARVVLGDALLSRRDLRGAERELRYALLSFPDSPASHMILANILAHAPDISKRKEAIAEAGAARELFMKIGKKQVEFKRGSLLHLIFGGGRYLNEPALAEVDYILAKAYINALILNPADHSRLEYLAEASKYLDESRSIAQKNSLKPRLALIYALSMQHDMLKGDTTSGIKNGKLALSQSASLTGDDIKCVIYPLLSQAYESNQTIRNHLSEAIKSQQEYIDVCRGYMPAKEMTEAQKRLEILKAEEAARKR